MLAIGFSTQPGGLNGPRMGTTGKTLWTGDMLEFMVLSDTCAKSVDKKNVSASFLLAMSSLMSSHDLAVTLKLLLKDGRASGEQQKPRVS